MRRACAMVWVVAAMAMAAAALAPAVVLAAPAGAQVAEGDGGHAEYARALESLRQEALETGEIPDGKLVERHAGAWAPQFGGHEAFERDMAEIRAYSEGDYREGSWNEKMVRAHNAVYNFDTMLGKAGHGHEIAALVAQKQVLMGKYNATEQEMRFHDWALEAYPAPVTPEAVDARLLEISGSADLAALAPVLADRFGDMATHGNVPRDLYDRDPRYWNAAIHLAMCEYYEGCDYMAMGEILESGAYADVLEGPPEEAGGWLRAVLPRAYAWTEVVHNTAAYGEPHTCTYGNCVRGGIIANSIGEHVIEASPPDVEREGRGHGTSQEMDIRVSTCSNRYAYNSVQAFLTDVPVPHNLSHGDWSLGCATLETTVDVSYQRYPSYVWHLRAVTNSWTNP